jgi:hypothetical protein
MEFFTISHASIRRHVSEATIRAWIRCGLLQANREYGVVLIKPEDLDACRPNPVGRPKAAK